MNPLRQLAALDQSVWLDYIRRQLLDDGGLAKLRDEDGLAGVTSNPAIFAEAIARHDDYRDAIAALARAGRSAVEIYEALVIEDVQRAADVLQPVYARSGGRDGYVSLEVSPRLAFDSAATVAEAERLWRRLARPNVMIKIPATLPGLAAITAALAAGLNVNVTLIFGVARYRAVVDAYLQGLEQRVSGAPPAGASVASFFVSRIDTLVDARLDALGSAAARQLRGQAAVASARLAYAHFGEWTRAARFQELARAGARPQRLLWASTGTKDAAYSDVKYVEELVGAQTVTTVPPQTLAAYRDHGQPEPRLAVGTSAEVASALAALGIDLETVAAELEAEGVRKFVEPYETLLAALEQARSAALG